MMAKGREKEIGDPLDEIARTGKIGGRPQPSRYADIQTSEVSKSQKVESPSVQQLGNSDIKSSENLEVQPSGPLNLSTSEMVKGQNVNSLAVQTSKGTHKGRTQKTIYLPPALAKRLKFASVEEEREISEIVTDALETYFKNKEKGSN